MGQDRKMIGLRSWSQLLVVWWFLLLICLVGVLSRDGEKPQQSQGQMSISQSSACEAEISRLCEKKAQNIPDLDALECILNRNREETNEISASCNHVLWNYRKSVTSDEGFVNLTQFFKCVDDFKVFPCWVPGKATEEHELLDCVLSNREKIPTPLCRGLLTRIEGIAFSDYQLISRFLSSCETDVRKWNCGRNEVGTNAKLGHSQGKTIECLSEHVKDVSGSCAQEILRIAEFQVDDFHLDRALFFACRDDREKFCSRVQAGNGRVYKCLMRHRQDLEMSTSCSEQIFRRQKLGWQDYKASGIVSSCRNEIKKYKCRQGVITNDKNIRLSRILLCLENVYHEGHEIDGNCLEEMKLQRRALMEDFNLTPEVITACAEDKTKFCANVGNHGKTIHCLMDHAQNRPNEDRLSSQCVVALENLLKMSDVASDWEVDPVLRKNCREAVEKSMCSKVAADHVLDCLMNLLSSDLESDSSLISEDCETTLIQIQYFLARDFPMDNLLYEACHKDAEQFCSAKRDWADNTKNMDPSRGPLVLSCLFRNIAEHESGSHSAEGEKPGISRGCAERVKETMRQRAISVHLMPQMEDACMEDLSELCSDKTRPGEELQCLQDHIDELDKGCGILVGNFTMLEMKHPTVDPFIWRHCREFIEEDCKKISEDEDVVDCLVHIKRNIKNKKCKTSVEHLQLLRLKEIKFSSKFKSLCQTDVMRYCNSPELQPLNSWKVVSCLSEIIRDDIVEDSPPRIVKGCRKQVRNLLFNKIQLEKAGNDDSVYKSCENYIASWCSDVTPGSGRILECLRTQTSKIPEDSECYQSLFKLQQETDFDSNLDIVLNRECATEINVYCYNSEQQIFDCLKLKSEKQRFSPNCLKVVRERQIEENADVRLSPQFQKSCKLDIQKFCSSTKPGQGRILGCLKKNFLNPKTRLTQSCKEFVEEIMKKAAKEDIHYDSDLFVACNSYINTFCQRTPSPDKGDMDGGNVEECLKQLFRNNEIKEGSCKEKVAQLIQSSMIDIHVDPILTHACAVDVVRHCEAVNPGEGRILSCLFAELNKGKGGDGSHLSERCRTLLTKRSELFKLVNDPGSPKMESLVDLMEQVQGSPHRNYFLSSAITIVGLIFVIGLFCGRATKRRAAEKNK